MAEQKDDLGQTAKATQSKKPTQSGAAAEHFAAADRVASDGRAESATSAPDRISATVVRRKQRYLIGFRSLPGASPVLNDPFLERLAQMEGVEIIRRLPGRDDRPAAAALAAA